MKNTNTNEFKTALKSYLAPIIEEHAEDYGEGQAVQAKKQPFAWALGTAQMELPHVYARHGSQACLSEWLQGCALNVAIYNCDIIDESEKLHGCKLTEKEKEKVIDNWFNFLAVKILQFSN